MDATLSGLFHPRPSAQRRTTPSANAGLNDSIPLGFLMVLRRVFASFPAVPGKICRFSQFRA